MTVKRIRKKIKQIKKYNPTKEKNDTKDLGHGWGTDYSIFRMKLKPYNIHISTDDAYAFFLHITEIDKYRDELVGSTTFGVIYDLVLKEKMIDNIYADQVWNINLVKTEEDFYNHRYNDKSRWKNKKDQTKNRNRERKNKIEINEG